MQVSNGAEETFVEHVCRNIREAVKREILRFKHKCRLALTFKNGMTIRFSWTFPYEQFPDMQPEIWQTLQEAGFTTRERGKAS